MKNRPVDEPSRDLPDAPRPAGPVAGSAGRDHAGTTRTATHRKLEDIGKNLATLKSELAGIAAQKARAKKTNSSP